MAKRKSPPKKVAKNVTVEDVIIDGVAKEVKSDEANTRQTKPKLTATQREELPRGSSKLSLIISLTALLFGISGVALGGLSYLSVTSTVDSKDQVEITNKTVDDRLSISLAPIYDQIAELDASVKNITDKQNDAISQSELENIKGEISNIMARLSEMDQSNSPTTNAMTHHNHTHEDYALLDDVNSQLLAIKDDIAQIKAERHIVQVEDIKTDKKPDENGGWWNNLLSVFSITRIKDTSEEEAE